MNIIKLVSFGLLAIFLLTASLPASAQDNEKHFITTINLDLKVSELTQDVEAVFVSCSVGTKVKDDQAPYKPSGFGHAVFYEQDDTPSMETGNAIGKYESSHQNENTAPVSFIPVKGLVKKGVNQKLSLQIYGEAKALAWQTGECELVPSIKTVSKISDWKGTINSAYDPPVMDCDEDLAAAGLLYKCAAPGSDTSRVQISFQRFPPSKANGK